MATPSDYITGTITLTNGSAAFTGTGTGWLAANFREGDLLLGIEGNGGLAYIIASITGNASGTLTQPWQGTTGTYNYRMRYQWDSSRISAQTRNLIELLDNGNLQSIATLTGPGVVVLEGPHSAGIRPFSDFINGVAYNVQVDTLADRAAYDGQAAGFAVLVGDVGNAFGPDNVGKAAVFSKASNTSGDWTDPAIITGPVGPAPEIEASVEELPAGSTATVTVTPIAGGYSLDFELPMASGFNWEATYNSANTYQVDDVVRNNGSSFIAIQAVPAGQSPSNAFPPVDNAYWQVLASRGQNGTGTGDVVGPASAANNRIAIFSGTTGKLIADGGVTVAQLEPARTLATQAEAEAGTGTTVRGWTPQRIAQAIVALAPVGDLEFTVSQIALTLADVTNQAQFLGQNGNRIADSFDTLTYVDVAGATNLNSSVAGVLKPTVAGNTDQTATHTSATQSGNTASASSSASPSFGATYYAWNAFDKVVGVSDANSWTTNNVATGWLQYQFATAKVIASYGIRSTNTTPTRAPRDWMLQASNTGAFAGEQVTLDTRTGQTGWAGGGELRIFSIASPASYLYYRLVVSANNVNAFLQIDEMTLYDPVVANNLVVRSSAFSASTVPSKMKALINVRKLETALAGTDYLLECSRDNGTTWTTMTLNERYNLPSGLTVVEALETDVSSQPSGSQPRWRFRTANNKNIELHDVYLYWK